MESEALTGQCGTPEYSPPETSVERSPVHTSKVDILAWALLCSICCWDGCRRDRRISQKAFQAQLGCCSMNFWIRIHIPGRQLMNFLPAMSLTKVSPLSF